MELKCALEEEEEEEEGVEDGVLEDGWQGCGKTDALCSLGDTDALEASIARIPPSVFFEFSVLEVACMLTGDRSLT